MLGKSLTIAAMAGALAGGLAAVPAQAWTSGKAVHQRHTASPSAPTLRRSAPTPLAAQRSMLMAREHWLSEHAGIRERAGIVPASRGRGQARPR